MPRLEANLVLADGSIFMGELIGYVPEEGYRIGEAIFQTGLSGYQEIITDPSYAGQIINFTYPHIGNYGTTPEDNQSDQAFCNGLVMRDMARRPSNHRSTKSLEDFMIEKQITGINGVDTRRLTRALRSFGTTAAAFGLLDPEELHEKAVSGDFTTNQVERVTTKEPYYVGEGSLRVVAYDFGIKKGIIQELISRDISLEVVPAYTPAEAVLEREPDGVFLSNGPGDPAVLTEITTNIRQILDSETPIVGICLGHQLLATALGAETEKLKFGHHGANHPVVDLKTGNAAITSQNHNYAVKGDTLKNAKITHVSWNDYTIEGIAATEFPARSIQYHPEGYPGPHDSRKIFDEFIELIQKHKK